ncbi:MAG TPA: hypothetical protein VN151_00795 [Terracidiphilus sp.]|nr:hypothetical protein [Terracidiphilus sp.]
MASPLQKRVLFAGRTTLDVLYRLDHLPEEDTKAYASALHAAFCYYLAKTGNCEQALREAAGVATRSCAGLGIDAWRR